MEGSRVVEGSEKGERSERRYDVTIYALIVLGAVAFIAHTITVVVAGA